MGAQDQIGAAPATRSRRGRLALAGLALVAAAILVDEPARASSFEEGQRAFDMRRFDEARTIWARLAEQGDPDAQFRLGQMLDSSLGEAGGPKAAFAWYLKAARQGHRNAQFHVAGMLDSGRAGERDRIAASVWYARAAAHGHALAQDQLAHRYENGLGAPRNLELAAAWRRLSAATPLGAEPPPPPPSESAPRPERLTPPVPVSDAQVIPFGRDRSAVAVELVWTAAPQPRGSRFFVEVKRAATPAYETVHAAYIDRSATIVPLPATPSRYLWRVISLAPYDGSYAASDWRRFHVGAPSEESEALAAAELAGRRDPLADLSRYSVALLYGRDDLPARRFARTLATDFRLSGLAVSEAALGVEPVAESAVEYFYREDRPIAEAVSKMLPTLGGKARFAPVSRLGAPPFPGAVAVTLRGGQALR